MVVGLTPAKPGTLASDKLWLRGQPWDLEGHFSASALPSSPALALSLIREKGQREGVEGLRGVL